MEVLYDEEKVLEALSGRKATKSMLNAYKKLKEYIMKEASLRKIEVGRDTHFNAIKLLREIVNDVSIPEDFNPHYYGDKRLLFNYINAKTSDISLEKLQCLYSTFKEMDDAYLSFLQERIEKLKILLEEIPELEKDKRKKELAFDTPVSYNWGDDLYWTEVPGAEDEDLIVKEEPKRQLSDKELIDTIKFINTINELVNYRSNSLDATYALVNKIKETKLKSYYKDPEFINEVSNIMDHDVINHIYYYFLVSSPENILEDGLRMFNGNINYDTKCELSVNDALLYDKDVTSLTKNSIAIVDLPKGENGYPMNIITKGEKDEILDNVIDPKFIVGYIDKENKGVIYNKNYYDYKKNKAGKVRTYE